MEFQGFHKLWLCLMNFILQHFFCFWRLNHSEKVQWVQINIRNLYLYKYFNVNFLFQLLAVVRVLKENMNVLLTVKHQLNLSSRRQKARRLTSIKVLELSLIIFNTRRVQQCAYLEIPTWAVASNNQWFFSRRRTRVTRIYLLKTEKIHAGIFFNPRF